MEQLITGARALHIPIQPEHLRAFRIYQEELLKWNERFNLTAITDDKGVQIRHFLDSLSCCLGMGFGEELRGQRVIDVGAGAGFPGLPLKILQPGIHLTLLEATGKKTQFLRYLVECLELEGVTVIHERAETLGQEPAHRERYDWAIARAVADTPILMEYLLPLANVGGQVLAQKGEGAPAEVQRSEWTIKTLGGHVRRLVPVELHGLAETRYLVLVDKVARTAPKYPRRPGMPSKRPLTAD